MGYISRLDQATVRYGAAGRVRRPDPCVAGLRMPPAGMILAMFSIR